MKLTVTQKQNLKNEIKKEKAPRVLDFDKEITLKKNENLTIEQIQEKVKESKKNNQNFIKDNNLRFNLRLAEMKKEKLIEIKNNLNQKYNINLTDKVISTLSAHTKDEEQLIKVAEKLINILVLNKIEIKGINKIKSISFWEIHKKSVKLWKETVNTVSSNEISFKDFVLKNKHLTLKEAKEQFSLMQKKVKENKRSFNDVEKIAFKQIFIEIFKEFTTEAESLYNIFISLGSQDKAFIVSNDRKQFHKDIEKMKVQSFSILKAFSKVKN